MRDMVKTRMRGDDSSIIEEEEEEWMRYEASRLSVVPMYEWCLNYLCVN